MTSSPCCHPPFTPGLAPPAPSSALGMTQPMLGAPCLGACEPAAPMPWCWGNGIAPGVPSYQQGCPLPPECSPPSHFPAPQVHSLQELRRSASLATKVFVQRDYSEGTTCQFQTKFPAELESRVGSLAGQQGWGVPYVGALWGVRGERGLKSWCPYRVLYGPGPADAAGCTPPQPPRPVCKGWGAPGDQEALAQGCRLSRSWHGWAVGRGQGAEASSWEGREG